jgi:biopolymer transport protein ExbD
MAIHSPGPQLFSSIPFKHLGGKGQKGSKSVLATLNLTALVDMMTMLVVFLLMTFSASGEILMAQRGMQLPDATQQKALQRAPIITVTADTILFSSGGNAEVVGDPRALMADSVTSEYKIMDLYEKLKIEKAKLEVGIESGEIKTGGGKTPEEKLVNSADFIKTAVILQADRGVDAKVLNRVMKTCYAAEFPNIMFAVNSRGGK